MVARSSKNGVKITTDNHSLDRYVLKKVGYFKEVHKGDVYREVLGDGTKIEIKQAGPNNINCTVVSPKPKVEEEEEEEEIPTFTRPGLCYAYLSEHDANSWEREYKFRIYSQSQGKFIDRIMEIPTEKSILYDDNHQAMIQSITYPDLENTEDYFVINTTSSHKYNHPNIGFAAGGDQLYVAYTRLFENSALTSIEYASAMFPPWFYKPSKDGKNLVGFLMSVKNGRIKVWKFKVSAYPTVPQHDYEKFVTMTEPDSIEEIANLRINEDMTINTSPIASNNKTPAFTYVGSWVTKDGTAAYISTSAGRQSQRILDLANETEADDLWPDVHGFFRTPELFKINIMETDTPEGVKYTANIEYIEFERDDTFLGDYQCTSSVVSSGHWYRNDNGSGPCIDCGSGDYQSSGTRPDDENTQVYQEQTNKTQRAGYEYLHAFFPDTFGEPVPAYTTTSGEAVSSGIYKFEQEYNGIWTYGCDTVDYTNSADTHDTWFIDSSTWLVNATYTVGGFSITSNSTYRTTRHKYRDHGIEQGVTDTTYERVEANLPQWTDIPNSVSCVEKDILYVTNNVTGGHLEKVKHQEHSGLYFDGIPVIPLDDYYKNKTTTFIMPALTFDAAGAPGLATPNTDTAVAGYGGAWDFQDVQSCGGAGSTWSYTAYWDMNGADSPTGGSDLWNLKWYYVTIPIGEWTDPEGYGPSTTRVFNRFKPWVVGDLYNFYASIDYANVNGDYLAKFRYLRRDGGIFLNDSKNTMMFNRQILPNGSEALNLHASDQITAIFII